MILRPRRRLAASALLTRYGAVPLHLHNRLSPGTLTGVPTSGSHVNGPQRRSYLNASRLRVSQERIARLHPRPPKAAGKSIGRLRGFDSRRLHSSCCQAPVTSASSVVRSDDACAVLLPQPFRAHQPAHLARPRPCIAALCQVVNGPSALEERQRLGRSLARTGWRSRGEAGVVKDDARRPACTPARPSA